MMPNAPKGGVPEMGSNPFCEICGKGVCPKHPTFPDLAYFRPQSLESYITVLGKVWKLPDRSLRKATEIFNEARWLWRADFIDAATACVYAAAVSTSCLPMSLRKLRELPNCIPCDPDEVRRIYKLILKSGFATRRICSLNPASYALETARKLKLPANVKRAACAVAREIAAKRLHLGKNPAAVGATACYLACTALGFNITLQEVAEAANVSDLTVRNLSRWFERRLSPHLRKT